MNKRVVTFVTTAPAAMTAVALAWVTVALVTVALVTASSVPAAYAQPQAPDLPAETPGPPGVPPGSDEGSDEGSGAGGTRLRFEPGVDSKSWFWDRQRDEEVSAGPTSQRARFPSPQRPDTLPVAVESGQPSKQSTIKFDLVGHGITAGSAVTGFVLTVAEGTDPGEAPTVNPEKHPFYACAATGFWPDGEAETWDTRPDTTDQCVPGKRSTDGNAASWTFDLSAMARSWGKEPAANSGVLLTGVQPGADASSGTWQVNLKAPQPDDPVTPEDEYKQTSHRLVADIAYTPAEPPETSTGVPGATDLPGGPPGGLPGGGGLGAGGLGGTPSVGGTAEPAGDLGAQPTSAANHPFTPTIPWYVWALIPLTFVATAMVRTALVENNPVTRPGGVIETIRSRNAEQWGAPSAEHDDSLLGFLTRFLPFERGPR